MTLGVFQGLTVLDRDGEAGIGLSLMKQRVRFAYKTDLIRIHDWFNANYSYEVCKQCIRSRCIEYGTRRAAESRGTRAERKPYYEFNLAEMWYRRNCINKASVYDKRLVAILPRGEILRQTEIFYVAIT